MLRIGNAIMYVFLASYSCTRADGFQLEDVNGLGVSRRLRMSPMKGVRAEPRFRASYLSVCTLQYYYYSTLRFVYSHLLGWCDVTFCAV